MNNEIRNELLSIYNYVKGKEEDKNLQLEFILERFEIDINRQLADIKYKQKELEDNLETLNYIRKKLRIEK